jgi:hypothetical protein
MAEGGVKVEQGVDVTNDTASSLYEIIDSVNTIVEKIRLLKGWISK